MSRQRALTHSPWQKGDPFTVTHCQVSHGDLESEKAKMRLGSSVGMSDGSKSHTFSGAYKPNEAKRGTGAQPLSGRRQHRLVIISIWRDGGCF